MIRLQEREQRDKASCEVDWRAAATLLLERMRRPAFVIGGDATIAMVNQGLVKLLGHSREVLVEAAIDDVVPTVDSGAWPLELALRGAIREFECVATSRKGERIIMSGELIVVGAGAQACVLAIATAHRAERGATGELRYTVRRDGQRARLLQVWRQDGAVVEHDGETDCFVELHGRTQVCEGCPLFAEDRDSSAVLSSDGGCTRMVTTSETDTDTYQVTSVDIPAEVVSQLFKARIEALATEAELTERERSVLDYILLARSADEIGTIMGISARTVKFHQANLLSKIGAESRLDLFRLIL